MDADFGDFNMASLDQDTATMDDFRDILGDLDDDIVPPTPAEDTYEERPLQVPTLEQRERVTHTTIRVAPSEPRTMATLAPQQQVFRAEWHGDKCKPLPVWSAPGRPPKRPRLPGSETAPSSSLWFKASRIHELERLALPDLFSGAYPHKTVEVYRAYRTAVLDAWKAAPPRTHITYTQVRRQMGPACDAATLLRVFRALEGWGLINHRTGQKPRFARSATMCEAYGNGESALRYVFDSSLLEPHQVRYSIASGPSDTTQGQKTRGDVAPPLAQTRFKCSATGVDCTAVRYQCTRIPDTYLSPEAYASGAFPPGVTSRDFVRVDGGQRTGNLADASLMSVAGGGWTAEEVLLLLEAIEKHHDNWDAIADHLGKHRTVVDCVKKFLQLPIEEMLMDDVVASLNMGRRHLRTALAGDMASLNALPFVGAPNPLQALVAFLAAMISPVVAAAAAQRALEVLEAEAVAAGLSRGGSGVPHLGVQRTLAHALAAAATRARQLANKHTVELERLAQRAVELQVARVEMKMGALERLNTLCTQERANTQAQYKAYMQQRETTLAQYNEVQAKIAQQKQQQQQQQ